MKKRSIIAHAGAINACNQRGGRMLSLVDLLEAESVDLPLASYLAAMMRQGNSLLVGAQPGGAGKTAVMCALLNFIPDGTNLQAVEGFTTLRQALQTSADNSTCYIAHEISPATYYYAYLWGSEARQFFKLTSQGYIIASNLHADTIEETRDQLIRENDVAPKDLDTVTLKVYLGTQRQSAWSMRRWIRRVYEHDGAEDRMIWTADAPGRFVRQRESHVVPETDEQRCADLLTHMKEENTRRIADVRRAVLQHKPES